MRRIVCKKCRCGLYHDITVSACECGADLTRVAAMPVEGEIPPEHYGQIDENLSVYVQKCSACGAENFTADPAKPAKICYNCHKARIGSVPPVLFEAEVKEEKPAQTEEVGYHVAPAVKIIEEEEDDGAARWQGILGGVQKAVGGMEKPAPVEAPVEVPSDDDDDDDIGAGGWGALLGGAPANPKTGPQVEPSPQPAAVTGRELTMTALRYGRLSFTLKADQQNLPLLLGRSAAYSEFLQQDGRVGNEHCYLMFRGENWYVIDNHAANGTAVNKKFLPINGEQILRDGDELMLGHHPDSMAFRVTIR